MKLYVSIWEDRHSDVTAHVFSSSDSAVRWAKETCMEHDRFDDYEEEQIHGWLYCGTYSCEGDGIHVVEVELDGEVRPEDKGRSDDTIP